MEPKPHWTIPLSMTIPASGLTGLHLGLFAGLNSMHVSSGQPTLHGILVALWMLVVVGAALRLGWARAAGAIGGGLVAFTSGLLLLAGDLGAWQELTLATIWLVAGIGLCAGSLRPERSPAYRARAASKDQELDTPESARRIRSILAAAAVLHLVVLVAALSGLWRAISWLETSRGPESHTGPGEAILFMWWIALIIVLGVAGFAVTMAMAARTVTLRISDMQSDARTAWTGGMTLCVLALPFGLLLMPVYIWIKRLNCRIEAANGGKISTS